MLLVIDKPEFQRAITFARDDHTKAHWGLPSHALEKLAQQFGHGLGFQLRSMPLAIRIDKEIFDGYPDLRPFQRRNVEQQLQECNHALSPKIKEIPWN